MTTRGDARSAARSHIAPLDADVLLAFALGVPKEAIYAHPEEQLSPEEGARFADFVRRRADGEPVAYIRRQKEFYGLELVVDPRVLIPRPETETLVDEARRFIRRTGARDAVDVGTGSGAVAVAIAVSEPAVRLIATDISAAALEVARANAARHGVLERIDLREGDLLAPVVEKVDLVLANLPYLSVDAVGAWTGERSSLHFEPRVAVLAGADGLDLVRRAVADLPRVLRPGGAALLEIDAPQADAVLSLVRSIGPARIVRDLAGHERVVVVSRR